MGALGRKRTFFVKEKGGGLKIPSDLLGVTPLEVKSGPLKKLPERTLEISRAIFKRVKQLGPK